MKRKIIFTVTNDLTYDQRMIRICSTMAKNGYDVLLVGRSLHDSIPLTKSTFGRKRLGCFFRKGVFFYTEFNFRLLVFLLFKKTDAICAIDLDTILPCLVVSKIKNVVRVYDAHELFCEMKEVVTRPFIYKIWKRIEKLSVPRFIHGYTVNEFIAAELKEMYNVNYEVIRNVPLLQEPTLPSRKERYIIYQGAVNEGRCFETMIPAMKEVDAKLLVCGDGNFMDQAKQLCKNNGLNERILFLGKVSPEALRNYTSNAYIGINLVENAGLSNYYSLANKFFDYVHAVIPQVCVNFPAYRAINEKYSFALMIDDTSSRTISSALNRLLEDDNYYNQLKSNCMLARQNLNWQQEEQKLLSFYNDIFPPSA